MVLTLGLVGALPFAFAYALLSLVNTVGIWLLRFATGEPWNGECYVVPPVLLALVLTADGRLRAHHP